MKLIKCKTCKTKGDFFKDLCPDCLHKNSDFYKKIQAMGTATEILVEILILIDEGYFGYDPYYRRMNETATKRAREILKT